MCYARSERDNVQVSWIEMPHYTCIYVRLGVSYLMTIAPAAGTLVYMEGVELVFVWIQKLCSHWTFQR